MYGKLIPGRAARPLATTAVAFLLAGIVISGCGARPAGTIAPGSSPSAATTTTAALTTPSGSGTCNVWSGVGDLSAIAVLLAQLATDEEVYPPGSDPINGDETTLNIAQMGLNQMVTQLPVGWAQAIQNQVLSVGGASSYGQLEAAANDAGTLANQISQLCYTP